MPFEKTTSGSDRRYVDDPYDNNMAQPPAFPFMQPPSAGGKQFSSDFGNYLFTNLANLIGGVKYGPRNVAPQTTLRAKRPGKSVQKQQADEMETLFNQLLGMVGAEGGATVDYESALRSSEQAIRDAYAQDIAAIRSGNKAARKDTARGRREIEAAYKALAKSYTKAGKRGSKQDERLARQMENSARKSANFVEQQGGERLDEMAALAEGLGIEAALPASSENLVDETNDTFNRIIEEGSEDANRQRGFGGNQRRFMNRGSQGARLEGTNRSTDLLRDLQDFLQGSRAQIAGLKGDRGRELASNEQAVMQGVAEMQNAAQSDQWDRLMQLAGLKMDIEKEQFDQSSNLRDYQMKMLQQGGAGGEGLPGLEGLSNAQQYLTQMSKPRRGSGIFDQFLNGQPMTTGSYYDDAAKREFKMTPEAAAKMIEQVAREEGLNSKDVNLLRLAILSYME